MEEKLYSKEDIKKVLNEIEKNFRHYAKKLNDNDGSADLIDYFFKAGYYKEAFEFAIRDSLELLDKERG